MERKGQSALEYLMTYGWALIVIAIVIGVLVFIMSTTTAGANCTSDNTQLIYVDHTVNGATDVQLRLQNGAGQTITVTAVAFDPDGDFAGTIGVPAEPVIVSGEEFDIISTTLTAPTAGATYRGGIDITYTRGTGGLDHTATITCTGTAA